MSLSRSSICTDLKTSLRVFRYYQQNDVYPPYISYDPPVIQGTGDQYDDNSNNNSGSDSYVRPSSSHPEACSTDSHIHISTETHLRSMTTIIAILQDNIMTRLRTTTIRRPIRVTTTIPCKIRRIITIRISSRRIRTMQMRFTRLSRWWTRA